MERGRRKKRKSVDACDKGSGVSEWDNSVTEVAAVILTNLPPMHKHNHRRDLRDTSHHQAFKP